MRALIGSDANRPADRAGDGTVAHPCDGERCVVAVTGQVADDAMVELVERQ